MTVICAPPSPTTVRLNGNQSAKPVTHTVSSLKKKVRFNERVRVRRRAQVPYTEEEFKAIWFSGDELFDRRRKDKKLRYAIARQPELFGPEKLLVLGLFNEEQRRQHRQRAIAAREAVLSQQKEDTMDVDSASCDSDDSSAPRLSTPTTGCYALHSQVSAAEAYVRALQHAVHVQTMDKEDDGSHAGMSQELSVSSAETAASISPKLEMEIPRVAQPPFGVYIAA